MAAPAASLLFLYACAEHDKGDAEDGPTAETDRGEVAAETDVFAILEERHGEKLKRVVVGDLDNDEAPDYVACLEIEEPDLWGAKFLMVDAETGETLAETPTLDGSLADATVETRRLEGTPNELLYYDSGDYFIGSSVGEIFAYFVDFAEDRVYRAHLFVRADTAPSLYISENADETIAAAFLERMRARFPELTLVDEDYEFPI
jgi:hypothetical protein